MFFHADYTDGSLADCADVGLTRFRGLDSRQLMRIFMLIIAENDAISRIG